MREGAPVSAELAQRRSKRNWHLKVLGGARLEPPKALEEAQLGEVLCKAEEAVVLGGVRQGGVARLKVVEFIGKHLYGAGQVGKMPCEQGGVRRRRFRVRKNAIFPVR